MYNTYAVQNHNPSGETFVLEYDDTNTIVGISGSWNTDEVGSILANMEDVPHLMFDADIPEDWEWQAPIATYDPNTGEVWRT